MRFVAIYQILVCRKENQSAIVSVHIIKQNAIAIILKHERLVPYAGNVRLPKIIEAMGSRISYGMSTQ